MKWLRETISDNASGLASSKRVSLLAATFSLAVSVVLLSAAALMGYDVAGELMAVAVPLAGLNGWSYTQGLKQEGSK